MATSLRNRWRAGVLAAALALSTLSTAATTAGAQSGGWGLDDTFGSRGVATTDVGPHLDVATDVAVQADGKIVVGGYTTTASGARDMALARYNHDGTLDTGFGHGGVTVLDYFSFTTDDYVSEVLIYPPGAPNAGEIVAVGTAHAPDDLNLMTVTRFATDGTLDKRAGASWGFVNDVPVHAYANAAAMRADGSVVIAGQTHSDRRRMAVAVFDADLALDPAFDEDGRIDFSLLEGQGSAVADVALYPPTGEHANKIVLAGASSESREAVAVVRMHPDGAFDASFDTDGEFSAQLGSAHSAAYAAAVQPDGKIVVAGATVTTSSFDFLALRLDAQGAPDSSFGQGGTGWQTVDFGGTDVANDMSLLPDGRVVLAGSIVKDGGTQGGLARLTATGSPDTTFAGGSHRVAAPIGVGNDSLKAMALASNGDIVAAGTSASSTPDNSTLAVARFTGDDSGVTPGDLVARMTPLRAFQPARSFPLSWSATGATGEVRYDVRVSSARYYDSDLSRPSVVVSRASATGGTATVGRGQGETVCYEVRAHAGGQTSRWSKKECTGIPLDDRVLGASGQWTRKRQQPNFYDRSWSGSLDRGAELFMGDVFAKRIAVMFVRCPGCGVATVFVNGEREKRVSLDSPTTVSDLVSVATFQRVRKRDIEIRVTRPGRSGVFVDAIGISLR